MFEEYDTKVKKLLSGKYGGTNWKVILSDHREKIGQIQHERLIHLLVMMFVGIIMVLFCLSAIITQNLYLIIFCVPLIFLFFAYIFHYYHLENLTQSWYRTEDKIKELLQN